jgi:predicted secreted protein
MSAWLIAIAIGAIATALQYAGTRQPSAWPRAALAGLRLLAVAGAVALLLNAPARPPRAAAPIVFLDGSLSMTRGDTALWSAAWDSAEAVRGDSIRVFGDSVSAARRDARPTGDASRVRPVVERAMAAGRAAVVITDGELQDSSALDGLVSGSRVIVLRRSPQRDMAVIALDAPRAAVQGDSLAVKVTISAASEGTAAGALVLQLGDETLARIAIGAMSPWSERQVEARVRVGTSQGPAVLRAIATTPGDHEPSNDTLGVALEVSRAASAVFVSTSPDQDARFALAVLRGALALPTRGYLRVAPGRWRHEGLLTPTTEAEVRQALADAPVAIIHGDTAIFGAPQSVTRSPLALIVPPEVEDGEWYVSATPPSPLSGALAAIPIESLPPVMAGVAGKGDWIAMEARRGREETRRAVVSGRDTPRRVAIVSASGFWRWRFRGGAGADAYSALWGGIFDWLAAERADQRDAVPDGTALRAGEPVRWRRGSSVDSTVRVILSRRRSARVDTLNLRFAPGTAIQETPGLDAGVYDVIVPKGRALLVVNASSELLPARPRLASGSVGRRASADAAGGVRRFGALYALVILLLCVEWIGRRRAGLR